MSMFRLVKRIQRKADEKHGILPAERIERDRVFNKIFFAWFVSAYGLGLSVDAIGLQFLSCTSCAQVADWIPAIMVMSEGSRFPEAMRFVLLYHTLTAPVWLVLMFVFDNERKITLKPLGYPLVIGFILFGFYVCVEGLSLGGENTTGVLNRMYYDSLLVSTLVSMGFWVMVTVLPHHMVRAFWSAIRHRDGK